jgi:hypothetical protein
VPEQSLAAMAWDIYSERGALHLMKRIKSYILINILYSKYFHHKYGDGDLVMQKEWDNLVLLDACRFDIFNKHSNLDGELKKMVSRGNYSYEFMERNFCYGNFHDVVYVSANPYSEMLDSELFHSIESVVGEWDSERGTVMPGKVTERVSECIKKYPEKRFIIHYMQPHLPHLGSVAQNLELEITGFDKYTGDPHQEELADGVSMWDAYTDGHLSRNQLIKSYIETLHIVEQEVKQLINLLDGKTVISADHGENLGETYFGEQKFGHGQDTKECLLVPWLELDFSERKPVTKAAPIGHQTPTNDVDQRLRDLGYK